MILRNVHGKINLHLRVLGRRPDGYHEIATLMRKIDLCDEMVFEPGGRGVVLHCPGTGLPEDGENIVIRAAALLFSTVGRSVDVKVTLRKRIPVAAGLGGGSANGAVTLLVLNELLGNPLDPGALATLGARVGADVPFFLSGRKAAWAFGIGERLEEAETPSFPLVLVNPGYEVSTRCVYEGLKMRLTKPGIQYKIPRLDTVPRVVDNLSNDLESVTLRLHPDLSEIKEQLRASGAAGTLMSGSGPTVFGVFETEEAAIQAAGFLKKRCSGSVWRTRTV